MQIVPMRELKNTVEIERRCAEENGPAERCRRRPRGRWPDGNGRDKERVWAVSTSTG